MNQLANRIARAAGVESLNPMQLAMANNKAPRTLLLAPTGSGKTLAFAIPLLRNCSPNPAHRPQAIVIAPSRELVMQIADVIRPIALPLRTVALYGGHPFADEERSLAQTPDIVVATPGRLLDHLNRDTLKVDKLNTLVLDEYDKSLELGFLDQMKRIAKRIGKPNCIILTSATRLTQLPDFLPLADAAVIDFTPSAEAPKPKLEIVEVDSPSADKIDTLINLAAAIGQQSRTIVFVNHRESAERVHSALIDAGFSAGLYHGGLQQQQRELAVELLNNLTTPILVATDLAARGLDIEAVDNIIHYHIPADEAAWTHRNGRAGRQGASGTVYTIVSERDDTPAFTEPQRKYLPPQVSPAFTPQPAPCATLYFNAGKREKISRGDIAGFLISKGNLQPQQVGHINVRDHYATAAIPTHLAAQVLADVAPHKIKNRRVKVTLLA